MLIAVDFWSSKTLIRQLEAIEGKSMFFCLTRQSLLCATAVHERWFLLYCTGGQRAEHFIWKITLPDKRTNHWNKCDVQVEIVLWYAGDTAYNVSLTSASNGGCLNQFWKCISLKKVLCSVGAVLLVPAWKVCSSFTDARVSFPKDQSEL